MSQVDTVMIIITVVVTIVIVIYSDRSSKEPPVEQIGYSIDCSQSDRP